MVLQRLDSIGSFAYKASDCEREYFVDNRWFQGGGDRLEWRRSMILHDIEKRPKIPAPEWGSTVRGVNRGFGWLQVGDYYLPMLMDGVPVLTPRVTPIVNDLFSSPTSLSRSTSGTKVPRDASVYVPASILSMRSNKRSDRGRSKEPLEGGSLRWRIAALLERQAFDMFLGMVVAFNVGVMIAETDQNANCSDGDSNCASWVVQLLNTVILIIYTVELALRIFVEREEFFKTRWNIIDFSIVMLGYLDKIVSELLSGMLPNMQMFRIFRVLRLVRAARLLAVSPELYSMVRGAACAMIAMFWGFVMIIVLLLVWSILAVETVHPVSSKLEFGNDYCQDAFSSVLQATLLFFQTLVAGDSWGACAVPIITDSPALFIVFAGALACVQLGFTNLILSVIVETAASAREADMEHKIREKARRDKDTTAHLHQLMRSMDEDCSGHLTFHELCEGYDNLPEMQAILAMLDIDRKDLKYLFELMDKDQSGACSYGEFTEYILKAQSQDIRVQMMIVKLQLALLSRRLQEKVLGVAEKVQTYAEQSRSSQAKYYCQDVAAFASEGKSDGLKPRKSDIPMPSNAPIPADLEAPLGERDSDALSAQVQGVAVEGLGLKAVAPSLEQTILAFEQSFLKHLRLFAEKADAQAAEQTKVIAQHTKVLEEFLAPRLPVVAQQSGSADAATTLSAGAGISAGTGAEELVEPVHVCGHVPMTCFTSVDGLAKSRGPPAPACDERHASRWRNSDTAANGYRAV